MAEEVVGPLADQPGPAPFGPGVAGAARGDRQGQQRVAEPVPAVMLGLPGQSDQVSRPHHTPPSPPFEIDLDRRPFVANLG